jgi:hypothetical protein
LRELWFVLIGGVVGGAAFALVEVWTRRSFEHHPRPLLRKHKGRAFRHRRMFGFAWPHEWIPIALAVAALLTALGSCVVRPASNGGGDLEQLREQVARCCSPRTEDAEIFGIGFPETALLLTAGFAGLGYALYRKGSRKTAGAMLVASTLFGLSGTKLLTLDKVFALDKFLESDTLFGLHINTANMLASSDEVTSPHPPNASLTMVTDEFEGFGTGDADLPANAAKPTKVAKISPKLLVLVGRSDWRELRRTIRTKHGSNWTLAERRAEAIARRWWPDVPVVILAAPPRRFDSQDECFLAPDRSVRIYAIY